MTLQQLLDHIRQRGVPPQAQCVYSGRNRVYRLGEWCIKDFHAPRWPNSWIYGTLRKSKARRSYEYSKALAKIGAAPTPGAYVEQRHHGALTRSYYIGRWAGDSFNVRFWENLASDQRDSLLADLARFMVFLHSHGVMHHDFSPGNILWRFEDGKRRFVLVDVNRMTIVNRPLNHRERLRAFRNINAIPRETARLGHFYGLALDGDAQSWSDAALKVRLKEIARKKRLHALKRLFKKKHPAT